MSGPAVAVCPGRSLRGPGFPLGTSHFWLSFLISSSEILAWPPF